MQVLQKPQGRYAHATLALVKTVLFCKHYSTPWQFRLYGLLCNRKFTYIVDSRVMWWKTIYRILTRILH